ncbi:hypothetical protein EYF80_067068 [Liparis tanakae]|uniref:Uncharacterized protein n=1 Tax=Liparis tanakae TaxID=230148 RepID=A0A4Z2E1R8_9TELE|nr:hypothetical protein EYF80_067068 [Liparis tanakae]
MGGLFARRYNFMNVGGGGNNFSSPRHKERSVMASFVLDGRPAPGRGGRDARGGSGFAPRGVLQLIAPQGPETARKRPQVPSPGSTRPRRTTSTEPASTKTYTLA